MRAAPGGKRTIAEADGHIGALDSAGETPMAMDDQTGGKDTIMPHLVYGEAALRKLYPPLEVPDAVDAQDPQSDYGDALVEACKREVEGIIEATRQKGRKKRINNTK